MGPERAVLNQSGGLDVGVIVVLFRGPGKGGVNVGVGSVVDGWWVGMGIRMFNVARDPFRAM